jgi:hypothetical protein
MKTLTVTKVRVGSLAKVSGIVQAVIGFVVGLVLTLGVAANSITEQTTVVRTLGVSVFALGISVLVLPAIMFVAGWVHGAIVALILNFVFRESHGLDLEVEESR